MSRDGRWYLIDVWRKRVDYPELKAAVRTLASRHAAKRVLVEDAGAGISLVQELLGEVNGILSVKPDRDKITRMSVVSAKFESGLVFLPERAPWLADLEAVAAILAALHKPLTGNKLYNICMDEPVDYGAVAAYLKETRGLDYLDIPSNYHSNRIDNSPGQIRARMAAPL
jgi:predicted phage terminase large subunit-like protein